MLANLVSWLGRSFNWNRWKCPEILDRVEVGNARRAFNNSWLLN